MTDPALDGQHSAIGRWLASPWVTIRVQLALGVIFVAAALPKIVHPPSFAHMGYNYRPVPGALGNLAPPTMPWVELRSGLALSLGILRGTAGTIIRVPVPALLTAI